MPDPLLFDAIEFATRAHAHQYRKGTQVPYIIHPLRVASRLIQSGAPAPCAVAGVLHDTLEDTNATAAELRERFGAEVTEIVIAVSEPDRASTWEMRKERTVNTLASAPQTVLWVACADKLDNVSSMQRGVERIGESFWERFSRPRASQGWYYRAVATVLQERAAPAALRGMTDELLARVDRLFLAP